MSEDTLCRSYTLIGWEQISGFGPFSLRHDSATSKLSKLLVRILNFPDSICVIFGQCLFLFLFVSCVLKFHRDAHQCGSLSFHTRCIHGAAFQPGSKLCDSRSSFLSSFVDYFFLSIFLSFFFLKPQLFEH